MTHIASSLTAVGAVALVMFAGACGGKSVTASDICGVARPLRIQVADNGAPAYAAHIDEWHKLIDMTKNAEDSELAKFGELVDKKSRNSVNYYSPLHQIEEAACDGEKPDPSNAD